MKKIILISIISLLWSGTLHSKILTPWKSKKSYEAVWECEDSSKIWISAVLRNYNPAMAFMSSKESDPSRGSALNLASFIYINPKLKSSYIFFKNIGGLLTKQTLIIKNKGANAELIYSIYPPNKKSNKEYSNFKKLNTKNPRLFLKDFKIYSENLYKITEENKPATTYKYKCKIINTYRLD